MQYLLTHVKYIRWIRKTAKTIKFLFGTESTVAEWWWHFVASAATSLTTILFFRLDFSTICRERQLQVSLAFRLLILLCLLCRISLADLAHAKFRCHNAVAWAGIRACACRGIAPERYWLGCGCRSGIFGPQSGGWAAPRGTTPSDAQDRALESPIVRLA